MEDRRRKNILEYSDIDLSQWKNYPDILTDTWWEISSRNNTNGHKLDYHGNFVPQIAYQAIKRYTKPGEIIIDWFLGSGTSAIEAANQNRRLIGIELKQDLVEYVASKIPEELIGNGIELITGDSTKPSTRQKVKNVLNKMGAERAQLAILHPPYADIIKFSNDKSDLSNCPNTEEFLKAFAKVAKNAYETLDDGRFAILVIGDKYSKGELDPLGFKCMQKMNEAGFKTKSIIVKNIEGNEKAKGKKQ